MSLKYVISICFFILLLGCTPYGAIPKGYHGQVVTLWDNVNKISSTNAHYFELLAIDGRQITTSSFDTRDRSFKLGFAMDSIPISRDIPINSQVLYIGGFNYLVADLFGLGDAIYRVKGYVQVIFKKGLTYMVNGKLENEYSIVWIEEEKTGLIVSDIIVEGNVSLSYLTNLREKKISANKLRLINIALEEDKAKKRLNQALDYFAAQSCKKENKSKISVINLYLMAESLFKNRNYRESLSCFEKVVSRAETPRETYRYMSLFYDVGLGVQENEEMAKYWQKKYVGSKRN